jgi:hypothetical protein
VKHNFQKVSRLPWCGLDSHSADRVNIRHANGGRFDSHEHFALVQLRQAHIVLHLKDGLCVQTIEDVTLTAIATLRLFRVVLHDARGKLPHVNVRLNGCCFVIKKTINKYEMKNYDKLEKQMKRYILDSIYCLQRINQHICALFFANRIDNQDMYMCVYGRISIIKRRDRNFFTKNQSFISHLT